MNATLTTTAAAPVPVNGLVLALFALLFVAVAVNWLIERREARDARAAWQAETDRDAFNTAAAAYVAAWPVGRSTVGR